MLFPLMFVAATAGAAHAGESPVYMWGVGPSLSTIAYPGRHPISFPKVSQEQMEEFDFAADVDADSRRITSLTAVRGDLNVGARGVLYVNKDYRGAIRIHAFSIADGYNAADVTFEVDKVLFHESKASAFGGVGLGFGTMRFEGETDAQNLTDPELSLATYLARGHVGGMYRWKTSAIEAGLFANLAVPGVVEFTGQSGDTVEITGLMKGTYWHGGLEATMYFGDFTPPKNPKSRKGRKGRR